MTRRDSFQLKEPVTPTTVPQQLVYKHRCMATGSSTSKELTVMIMVGMPGRGKVSALLSFSGGDDGVGGDAPTKP